VGELESYLGIGSQSLDKINAKTLDKLVLEKLRCKSEPLSDSCLPDTEDELKEGDSTKPLCYSSSKVSTVIVGQNILKKKKRKFKSGTYRLPGQKQRERKASSRPVSVVSRVKKMYRKRSWSQDSAASAASSLRSTRSSVSKTVASESASTCLSGIGTEDLGVDTDTPVADTDKSTVKEIFVESSKPVPSHDIDFDTVVSAKLSVLRVIGTIRQRSSHHKKNLSPAKSPAPFKQPLSRVALSERENLFAQFSPSRDWLSTVNGDVSSQVRVSERRT